MKYPYLSVALLVFFGLIDVAIIGNQFGLDASTWPGWVQAVGSIAALVVAIFVMSRQNRHAAKLIADGDKRAILRRTAAVTALVDRAHRQINVSQELILAAVLTGNAQTTRAALAANNHALQEMHTTLRAIPTHELGAYQMVVGVNQTIETIANFVQMCGRNMSSTEPASHQRMIEFFEILDRYANQAKQEFDAGVSDVMAS